VRRIHDLTGESATMLVRGGDHVVMIDGIETRKHGVWRVRVGALFNLWGPAAGRVMLAHDSDAGIADYLKRTGQDNKAIRNEIAAIREQGYARVARSTPPQMVSVAFPVLDIDGRIHGALAVGGPRNRFEALLDEQMPELLAIVADLNRRSRLFPADDAGSELH
jgi:DNA-binding IclR family transcriptional regulator